MGSPKRPGDNHVVGRMLVRTLLMKIVASSQQTKKEMGEAYGAYLPAAYRSNNVIHRNAPCRVKGGIIRRNSIWMLVLAIREELKMLILNINANLGSKGGALQPGVLICYQRVNESLKKR